MSAQPSRLRDGGIEEATSKPLALKIRVNDQPRNDREVPGHAANGLPHRPERRIAGRIVNGDMPDNNATFVGNPRCQLRLTSKERCWVCWPVHGVPAVEVGELQ